jgi:hypothetical protein
MVIRITIEAASKVEAELIARELPVKASAQSWRGFGVIRLRAGSRAEKDNLVEAVSRSFQEHRLQWARVRYDDEERVFKANGNGHRAAPADQSTGSASGSASPAIR